MEIKDTNGAIVPVSVVGNDMVTITFDDATPTFKQYFVPGWWLRELLEDADLSRTNFDKPKHPQHQYRSTRENNGVWVNCSKEEYDAAMDLARFEVRVVEI